MRTRLLFLPALLLLVAWTLRADPPMSRIVVEVKSISGKPVDRASVVVRFVEGRSIVKFGKKSRLTYEMRTDQEGLAKIPAIPQGKILIQVIAKHYQTFGQTFEVTEPE